MTPALASILLLVVVVVITVGMILWGVPLINDMNADSIYKNDLGSMRTLDQQLRIVSRGQMNDMRSSSISMAEGNFAINEGAEVWCISYQTTDLYTIRFLDLGDMDEKVYIDSVHGNIANIGNARVNASWLVTKGATASGTVAGSSNMQVQPVSSSRGYVTLTHPTSGAVHLTVEYGGRVIAGAFIVSLDEMTSRVSSTKGSFDIRLTGGGMTSTYPSKDHVEEGMDIRISKGSGTLIVNFILLENRGISSASRGIYNVNMELVDREAGGIGRARDVRLEIFGSDHDETWYDHLGMDYRTTSKGVQDFTGFAPDDASPGMILLMPNTEYPTDNGVVTLKVQTSLIRVSISAK